jgi:Na+-driven multidrug efflux pump
MIFAFIGFIVLRAAFAYLFAVPGGLGATGIWYGEATANVLMALVASAYFLRGTWIGRVVGDDAEGASPKRSLGDEEIEAADERAAND